MGYNIDTGMYEGYIYCVENLINGKKYIGYTKNNIETRWKQHLSKTHHREDHSILHLAIEKYSDSNFTIYPLCTLTDDTCEGLLKKLKEAEIEYIRNSNTLTPNGYNILSGGETVPINRITPLYQYTMDGEFIQTFKSITEAIQYNGFNDSPRGGKLLRCLRTDHCAFGYLWDTTPDSNVKNLYLEYTTNRYKRKNGGAIVQLDMNMNVVKHYRSVADAARQTGFPYSTLHATCYSYNGCKHIYKGYIWMCEQEYYNTVIADNAIC